MKIWPFALVAFSVMSFAAQGSGSWNRGQFDESATDKGIGNVSSCKGVYIIYSDGDPYYVGRSRVSVYARLRAHITGRGSRKVAELLGGSHRLTYEYECLDSVEQMEAQLIDELGTTRFGNLRRETDPADWDD